LFPRMHSTLPRNGLSFHRRPKRAAAAITWLGCYGPSSVLDRAHRRFAWGALDREILGKIETLTERWPIEPANAGELTGRSAPAGVRRTSRDVNGGKSPGPHFRGQQPADVALSGTNAAPCSYENRQQIIAVRSATCTFVRGTCRECLRVSSAELWRGTWCNRIGCRVGLNADRGRAGWIP